MEHFDTTKEAEENFYDIIILEEYVEDDELSTAEEGFMRGYLAS